MKLQFFTENLSSLQNIVDVKRRPRGVAEGTSLRERSAMVCPDPEIVRRERPTTESSQRRRGRRSGSSGIERERERAEKD